MSKDKLLKQKEAYIAKMNAKLDKFLDSNVVKKMNGDISPEDIAKLRQTIADTADKRYVKAMNRNEAWHNLWSNIFSLYGKGVQANQKLREWSAELAKNIIPTKVDDTIINLGLKAGAFTDETVAALTQKASNIEAKKAQEYVLNKNHSSWYTRFKTKKANAEPNYDNAIDSTLCRLDDSYPFYRPLVIRFPISLVLPNSDESIKRIYHSINANQTSLMNARGVTNVVYDMKDVTNYIENTRFALALIAKAQRTIKSYNNFNIDNVMEPNVLIYAENPTYYTADRIRAEKATLVSLKEDLRLLIEKFKVNVAGSTPLYDRTLFLLSNMFKDNKSSKNVVYMFDLDNSDADGLFTYSYRIGNSLQTETVTITDVESILNAADALIENAFIKDKYAKQVKSDINYLYGLAKAQHFSTLLEKVYATIDKPVDVIGDDYGILRQINNISVSKRLAVSHVLTGNHPGYNVYSGTVTSDEILLTDTPLNGITGTKHAVIDHNTDIVNAEKTLSSDETYVATRFLEFVNTKNNHYWITAEESTNNTGLLCIRTQADNSDLRLNTTELVHSVQAVTYNPTFDGHSYEFDSHIFILPGNVGPQIVEGLLGQWASENIYIVERATMWWSFCDWMPRMYVNMKIRGAFDSEAESYEVKEVIELSNDVMYDYNMTGRTPLSILRFVHSTALISMLIWSDNGSNIISLNAKYAGNNNRSRDKSNK